MHLLPSRAGRRRLARPVWLGVLLVAANSAARACPACAPLVEAGVYGENFVRHLLLMLLPIAVLVAIAAAIYKVRRLRSEKKEAE